MASTTNYSWTTPDDTGLVKDGAAAIRTLGTSIDTTTKNLNPSTTLGDIEYRSSSANVNTRLGIGSTGNVLTVVGGVPAWTAPAGGGKILQVVASNQTLNTSTTSTDWSDTGLTVTITPSSASSRIYVSASFNQVFVQKNTAQTSILGAFRLVRDSTTIHDPQFVGVQNFPSSTSKEVYGSPTFTMTDSPATTSATTYKVQFQEATGFVGTFVYLNKAYITVMEIGA